MRQDAQAGAEENSLVYHKNKPYKVPKGSYDPSDEKENMNSNAFNLSNDLYNKGKDYVNGKLGDAGQYVYDKGQTMLEGKIHDAIEAGEKGYLGLSSPSNTHLLLRLLPRLLRLLHLVTHTHKPFCFFLLVL